MASTLKIDTIQNYSAAEVTVNDALVINETLAVTGNSTLTGTLAVTGATTLSAALTYGGVALSNAVTGTGKMVLDTSPTLVTPVLGVATGTSFQGIIGNVTPAAGSFTTLTTTGKQTNYNSIATVSNGIPAEYATVDLTAQTAAVGTTTLYAVPASGAGQYRVSWNAKVTTPATTGAATSTLGALTIVYTDPDTVVQTITAIAQRPDTSWATTNTSNTTTTFLISLPLTLNCSASTNITYAMAYASDTANQMAYNLHLKCEALG